MFKQVLYAIRVLDLAPGWSAYTGRLLGDLGAEVIKIEPPGGDPLRGTPDFGRLNANKYGCTLDVSDADGLGKLQRLALLADIVIAPPDAVDLDSLMAAKGSLIAVSLPSEAGVEQTIAAAAGVGVALWDRRRTGEGSRIDVAAAKGEQRPLPASGEAIREAVSTLSGDVQLESSPWYLSESPTHVRLPAPALGGHNEYVLGALLRPMRTAVSRNGVPIRLNDERWAHILQEHAELEGQSDSVLKTIEEPDWIWQGRINELIAGRLVDDLYLIVAYREVTADDGFVLTAYLTRRPAKRNIVWKR